MLERWRGETASQRERTKKNRYEIDNVYVIDMTGYERIKILFQRINYEDFS